MIFEITPEHIEALNDTDLRNLIGFLAEQEVIKAGHSPVSVTYGGDQNASDGGVDVRVDLEGSKISGYIPRAATGFQVKAEDMPNKKILSEMRPKDILRPSIKELGTKGGAYIIVSSKGSVSDTSLAARKGAMSAALASEVNVDKLFVDFYDRRRVATWVNQHPGLIPWVRTRVGQSITGWQPFRDWSSSPGPIEEAYIIDDHVRILNSQSAGNNGIKAIDGIHIIREILSKPMGAVRLVGLSGVGKTRFSQALFDPKLGEKALNKHEVIYADLSDSPDPVPLELLSRLQQLSHSCILIVDNCGAELHRKLVTRIKQAKADIRILTIEYDVSDEEPEGTRTFKLEPASSETVAKIVERRYPTLSSPEIQTIAKFSEGNSRVALALAETSQHGESLANINDKALIQRLFQQNHKDNPQLARAASVCSLVYSFNGENIEDADTELKILADMAEQTVSEMHAHVAELHRRQLVQKRSEWRAVLPHALAHKLAKQALQDIPKDIIRKKLVIRASERQLKSFSRRLGCLHDSLEAQAIAKEWLSTGGILHDIANLNSLGCILLDNIAPINPKAVLNAIVEASEKHPSFISEENANRSKIVELLRSLAYDPENFDIAVHLIARFTGSIKKSNNTSEAINIFKSFFFLYFPGTHASVEQRANFLLKLAKDHDEIFFDHVMEGLDAMLECNHFSSHYNFDFGARKRDYGVHPKINADISHWYKITFNLIRDLSNLPRYADPVKKIIASQFRLIASKGRLLTELIALAEFLAADKPWPEGWIGVLAAARQARRNNNTEQETLLNQLALKVAPNSLADEISVYVLPEQWGPLDIADIDFDDDNEKRFELVQKQVEEICIKIGLELSQDISQFSNHLPLILNSASPRSFTVAREVGNKAQDKQAFWNITQKKAFASSNPVRSFQFVSYFLAGVAQSDKSACNAFLDHALKDVTFHPFFVHMQSIVGLDSKGLQRLTDAVKLDTVPVDTFSMLSFRGICAKLTSTQMRRIILPIAERDNGLEIAIHIFYMRLAILQSNKRKISDIEKSIGQALLCRLQFNHNRRREVHELSIILKSCLTKPTEHKVAKQFANLLLAGIINDRSYTTNYNELISELAKTFPRIVLDIFVDRDKSPIEKQREVFSSFRQGSICPFANISEDLIIEWAYEDSESRFRRLAQCVKSWERVDKKGVAEDIEDTSPVRWTKLAMRILDEAPDPLSVLAKFLDNLRPSSWSGSLADVLQSRLPLIEELSKNKNAAVAAAANATILPFQREIDRIRAWDAEHDRILDERFEW